MPDPTPIPEVFARNTLDLYGQRGAEWLARLPGFLAELEQRWSIRVLPPFTLSYNYVAPAVRVDGTGVVVKVGIPNKELTSEIEALRHYAGRGIVKLLDGDAGAGAMLLEQLTPGETLYDLPGEEAATRIAAEVLRDLWIPAPPDPESLLNTVEGWAVGGMSRLRETFQGNTGPFSEELVEAVEGLTRELLAASSQPVLLHGDFHHWNILSAERQPWLAIDPKGLVGEREYELVPFLYNRWTEGASSAHILRLALHRLKVFEEMLDLDMQRMLAWSVIGTMLSAWWTYEGHRRVDEPMISLSQGLLNTLQSR